MAFVRSLDGHPLQIKQLRGEEPVELINLSSKRLTVLSASVIASLIASNTATKSLKYAAEHPFPYCQHPLTVDMRLRSQCELERNRS